jgi:Tfp pilus assembly PilM family ATPase
MARSCGLRLGSRRFELVVLDGSPKKSRVVASAVGDLPRVGAPGTEGSDEAAEESAAIIARAIKQHAVPTDNIGLAIDTGLAAFRPLKMPFADRAKIEAVLKFEVESLLPQWSIDDVVVDFHTLEATADSSELLITAVQKADLRRALDVCTRAGIEPQEAELEATAMVNAALAAGVCPVDTAQILVHIGELSTSVVIMDGGRLREMRAIHLGAMSHDLPAAASMVEPEAGAAPPAPVEGAEPRPEPAPVVVDPADAERRLDQVIRRIRRELGRTVSAARTAHPVEGVYVCGIEVPGLLESTVLDVPVRPLDVFGGEGGQPQENAGELVVAYGAALRQLGGGVFRPSLRREELRYTGALERLELPFAVVALLLVTLLGVWNIFLYKDITFVDANLGTWRDYTRAYLLGDLKKGRPGALKSPSEDVKRFLTNMDAPTDLTKYEQMERLRGLLQGEVKKLEKDLGQDTEVAQPQSALAGLTLVLDVLEKLGTETTRPSLRKVTSVYQRARTSSNKADTVKVSLDVTFFADSPAIATNFYESFARELRSKPWFVNLEERPNQALEDGKGIFMAGLGVTVDVSKAPLAQTPQ